MPGSIDSILNSSFSKEMKEEKKEGKWKNRWGNKKKRKRRNHIYMASFLVFWRAQFFWSDTSQVPCSSVPEQTSSFPRMFKSLVCNGVELDTLQYPSVHQVLMTCIAWHNGKPALIVIMLCWLGNNHTKVFRCSSTNTICNHLTVRYMWVTAEHFVFEHLWSAIVESMETEPWKDKGKKEVCAETTRVAH